MNSQEAVIKVLQAATSQDVNHVKNAESQLKLWEGSEGFYCTLLDIFLMKNVDVNIRWISIICLKNGIVKYWRKSGAKCLCEEEKRFIRSKILTVYDEEVIQLAFQLAVIVGKVARIDIKQWPDVIQQTLEVIKAGKSIPQHRALLTLNQILKELASKRLITDQLVFREISSNIFDYLAQLNYDYLLSIFHPNNTSDLNATLEMCILITKVLRKLLVYGGKDYSSDSSQINYLKVSLQHVQSLMSVRSKCNDGSCKEKMEKLIIWVMKILSEMQERHTLSFIPVLEETMKLCLERIFTSNGSSEFNSFVIYCGNLLRSITRTYKEVKRDERNSQVETLMRNAIEIRDRLLTKDCVKRLCQHLIMNYFPLTQYDLEEWTCDPEGYMLEEAGESHKFLLRPCIEALFVSLFYEYRSEINPFILNLTKELDLLNIGDISSEDVIKVCTVYTAVGLASYELFHDLDFDMWCETKLFSFMVLPLKPIPVLQQHILWMIGQWINVKFSKNNRITLYQILSQMLSTSDDLVLKLTACKVLRSAIDDFDFDANDFGPYVNNIFVVLCQLLVQVDVCDTKMMVLSSLSVMIERIDEKVRDEADLLLECLPQLWELSEAHNLLRGAVINVLVHLVKGLGEESIKILHITLPIIQYSTSVDQPAHVYLLEDGLELWLLVLKTAKHLTSELVMIYKNIPILLQRASETLSISLSITRSYLLIDAKVFLKEYSGIISKVFSELMGNIKDEATLKITDVLKLALQLVPTEFLSMFQSNMVNIFDIILRGESYATLIVSYLTIFAYIILYDPLGFTNVVQLYCQSQGYIYEEVMERLFDIWLDKVDCMSAVNKKVTALSLCTFLPHQYKFVVDRFALILDMCVNVMYDIQKTEEEDGKYVSDSLLNASSPLDEKENNEDAKEREVLSHDPARTVNLLHYVRSKLNETKLSYGEECFAEAMQTMDSAVAKQLLSLVNV